MRWILGVLLVANAAVFTGCDPGIEIHFVNKTSSTLCWYWSEKHIRDPDYCDEIGPYEDIPHSAICRSDYEQLVLLTVGVAGDEIYNRTATCGEWKDSGAKIVIDRIDGKFVVTSSLPDPTPTPTP